MEISCFLFISGRLPCSNFHHQFRGSVLSKVIHAKFVSSLRSKTNALTGYSPGEIQNEHLTKIIGVVMTLNSESKLDIKSSADTIAEGKGRIASSSVIPNLSTRKENSEQRVKSAKEYGDNFEEKISLVFTAVENHKSGTATERERPRESIVGHPNNDVEGNESSSAPLTKNQTTDVVRSDVSPMLRANDNVCVTVKPNDTPVGPTTENVGRDALKNQTSLMALTTDKPFENPGESLVNSETGSKARVTREENEDPVGVLNKNKSSDKVRNGGSQLPSATNSLFVSVRPSDIRVAEATAIQGCTVRVEGSSVASIVSPLEIVSELLNGILDDVALSRLQVTDRFSLAKMDGEQNRRFTSTVSAEVKNSTGLSMHTIDTFSKIEGEKGDCNTETHIVGKGSNKTESTAPQAVLANESPNNPTEDQEVTEFFRGVPYDEGCALLWKRDKGDVNLIKEAMEHIDSGFAPFHKTQIGPYVLPLEEWTSILDGGWIRHNIMSAYGNILEKKFPLAISMDCTFIAFVTNRSEGHQNRFSNRYGGARCLEEKHYIFIPLNQRRVHWTLFIIDLMLTRLVVGT